jgi:hypothetical protein
MLSVSFGSIVIKVIVRKVGFEIEDNFMQIEVLIFNFSNDRI